MKNNFKIQTEMENIIEFKRRLDSIDIRSVCVKNNYYTLGSLEEYNNILNYANRNCQTNVRECDIEYIAKDIFKHSNIEELCINRNKEPMEIYLDIISELSYKISFYTWIKGID